jgi:uncharacterized protein (DUF2336 family)
MPLQDHPLFVELEATLTHGAGTQRFTILRRMTDLFLAGSTSYTDEHVAIFDELIGRLIEKIERQALVELSGRLAPVDRAPRNVIGRLSRDEDIGISGPILEQSNALTDNDLVEIAQTKSQAHLSAIAGRKRIGEPVTDVLIVRGNSEVARKVTTNAGARFSRFGLSRAVQRAEADASLAVAVASRMDLPPDLLDLLVRKATTAVKERLLANARPEMKARITQVLFDVSSQVARSVAPGGAQPRGRPTLRHDSSRTKDLISQCVESRNVEGLIDALAIHCEVPVNAVKNIVQQHSGLGMLVLGKASGIGWPDMKGILSVTLPEKAKSPDDVKALFADFVKLTPADAQRAIRFIRTSTAKSLDKLKELV